jgi:hypothetical protein
MGEAFIDVADDRVDIYVDAIHEQRFAVTALSVMCFVLLLIFIVVFTDVIHILSS